MRHEQVNPWLAVKGGSVWNHLVQIFGTVSVVTIFQARGADEVFPSAGLLRGVFWRVFTGVLGATCRSIFRHQALSDVTQSLTACPLTVRPTYCTETSVTRYQPTSRNIPEERRYYSYIIFWILWYLWYLSALLNLQFVFLKMFQQDDTFFLYSILFPVNGSTCFRWKINPKHVEPFARNKIRHKKVSSCWNIFKNCFTMHGLMSIKL
jgi:hypothetical protein